MSAKKLVEKFYKSEALINEKVMDEYLHPDFLLEWHSSKGFIKMNRAELLSMTKDIEAAYISCRTKFSSLIAEKDIVSASFMFYANTIENPREEMLLAHLMVTWEIKDDKLYRGSLMSQFG